MRKSQSVHEKIFFSNVNLFHSVLCQPCVLHIPEDLQNGFQHQQECPQSYVCGMRLHRYFIGGTRHCIFEEKELNRIYQNKKKTNCSLYSLVLALFLRDFCSKLGFRMLEICNPNLFLHLNFHPPRDSDCRLLDCYSNCLLIYVFLIK